MRKRGKMDRDIFTYMSNVYEATSFFGCTDIEWCWKEYRNGQAKCVEKRNDGGEKTFLKTNLMLQFRTMRIILIDVQMSDEDERLNIKVGESQIQINDALKPKIIFSLFVESDEDVINK